MSIASLTFCVYTVRISINELDLVPNRIVAGRVGLLRKDGDLGTGESYIAVVFGIEWTSWVFLQHLNSQQLLIPFTVEIENGSTIALLGTSVYRETDGLLTTSVYWKPTHTDQTYDSHHPQSVKRGMVKCLYDRAKPFVTKPSVIAGENKHLSSVLVSNGYPFSFVQNRKSQWQEQA